MNRGLAIQADRVTKLYGATVGCQNVTLAVEAGQVFGFLGPNGAGKSTLVKVLAGLHRATSGSAYIFGYPVGTPEAGRLLGFVPELFGMPTWARAGDLLRFYGQVSDVPARELSRRIDEVLERVGLSPHLRSARVGSFSKGMRQRLCIAAALLHRPRVLILDEPTSALDPVGRREVRDLILALREEGVAVFLNSHLLSEVEAVADSVAIIRAGCIVMSGTPADLMGGSLVARLRADPFTPALERSLGELGRVEHQAGGRVLLHLRREEDLAQVAPRVLAQGAVLLELIPQRQSLEDLFMAAVGEVEPDA